MKFPDDSSKRQRLHRFDKTRKYIFLKKNIASEQSMAQMKHKPYSCDFKSEKKGCE